MTSPEDPVVQPSSEIAVPATDHGKKTAKKKIETTRVSYAWLGLVLGAFLTIVMMVFILQNLDSAKVSFLAWEYEIPTGIAMLLSAVAGALITAAVGGVRILQVKRQARKL
ncbi:MAG: lipopolysaccharide assembly protein LapA domain-containing protein [Nocardiaceae bacterium]|nr:lipopolysaccharide assembly protein LapA domain-containing protein [Nocardiaceae bacterium]